MKDREHYALELMFQFRVIAVAFITHESVGAVDFDPLVVRPDFVEASENPASSFERDVGSCRLIDWASTQACPRRRFCKSLQLILEGIGILPRRLRQV